MSDDLITSLRALAAAQHSDLTVAADAADRIERLTRERDESKSKETDYREGFEEGWDAAQRGAADEIEKLTRERDEARAEVERLREALRDALDGLRYWVPQTSVGAVEKCRIVEKGIEALEAKP